MKLVPLFLLIVILTPQANAQSLLNRNISLEVNRQKLADVLEIISNKGNFYFSYNSSIVKRDSLVSLSATNKTVQYILGSLLSDQFEFRESGNHIIIRRKPIQLTITTIPKQTPDKFYSVAGYVSDGGNGAKLHDVSVYEKEQLIASLSDEAGYFNLKLRSRYAKAEISVSKEFYYDTSVAIQGGNNQQIDVWLMPIEADYITISPEDYLLPDSLKEEIKQTDTAVALKQVIKDTVRVDKKFLSRTFVSSKQKIQSLNLGNFFTDRPYQVSLIPGIGTHGSMSGQVINHFSLNVFGGYTGGLNGFEMGGFFNINKKDVGYVQLAGMFNLTGGQQRGLQMAGISNTVLDSAYGFLAAGVTNFVKGNFTGLQTAGVYNHAALNVDGVQAAGVANFAQRTTVGVQIAGVGNFVNDNINGVQVAGVLNYAAETNGAQIAGVVNYTKHLKGLQIGLINIADTSDGYSIGLINFVRRGYHKIMAGPTESTDLQVALKSGNRKLYSIFIGSINTNSNQKLYSYGYGLGRVWIDKQKFALSTDLTSQYLHLGSWDYLNLLNTFALHFNVKLTKGIAIYGGPSFNYYYSKQPAKIPGYAFALPRTGFASFTNGQYWSGWGGWQAGISLF